ncbi:hypothetical protein GUITHDRAFT_102531 [Guillardia theta CCMP2712]|uniref:Uncharacterized protein n=1 Tax=Guillardia theta (strain CCMP2712) TaxID=905079 RepID=L1JUD6_GUITC|nr:hypothetical protein GUITHDRAFT_102531 [Guillardia theta CCMP2712]EKX51919.1 hypothetical protein GUITHDRAFT_102531 [Guillardia theta CCMP2712]|eukprot:XP_005838899.1 hypothetical protein GUITHDRAFT_102531 [Guillardia theta CCMP2712]
MIKSLKEETERRIRAEEKLCKQRHLAQQSLQDAVFIAKYLDLSLPSQPEPPLSPTDQEQEPLELSLSCTREICKQLSQRFLEKQKEEKKLQAERDQLFEDFGRLSELVQFLQERCNTLEAELLQYQDFEDQE